MAEPAILRVLLAASALSAVAWGCASIVGADFDKPFQTASSSGGPGGGGGAGTGAGGTGVTTSSTGGNGGGGEAPDAGDGGDVPACTLQSNVFNALADTQLVNNGLPYGDSQVLSVNQGLGIRGVLRFRLAAVPGAFAALQAGSAHSIKLTLTRVPVTGEAGACSGACPHAPGRLGVYPLKNAWDEATAKWATPWTGPGASSDMDRGAIAALAPETGVFTGVEPTLTVTLAPDRITAPWLDAVNSDLSLLLTPEDGLTYVFAAKEHPTLASARLEIVYCI